MKILILRHGHAHALPGAQRDFDRELSERGRLEIVENFFNYSAKLPEINYVWVSPLKRAQQTAEEFFKIYGLINSIELSGETKKFLRPDDAPEDVIANLQSHANSNILLVTHQPLASSLIDLLCGQPFGFHAMVTASMACINCEYPAEGLGELVWIHHPT